MDIGSLVTKLMMDANQFDSTIKRSQKEIVAFKSKAEGVGRGVNSVFNGIAGTAIKLVPAIAAGTTALGAFNKILKSSGSLSDYFDKISLQIGSSLDYIASRAADINFDNAIDGLKESLKIAGQLAETLDSIGTHNTYSAFGEARLRKFKAVEDRERANYELHKTPENKARLDAAIRARNEQQVIVNKNFDEAIRLQNEKIESNKKAVAANAGFAKDKRAIQINETLATNEKLLAESQKRLSEFKKVEFRDRRSVFRNFRADSYLDKLLAGVKNGADVLKLTWNELQNNTFVEEFAKVFKRITGLDFTRHNYEESRRFILQSNKEGLGEGKVDITALTNDYITRENLEAAKYETQTQTYRDEKRSRDKTINGITKSNTKLTNTNETLEEINKKFEDAKAILSLQNKEGYLDKESYLKELLKTTNNYIDKLYDPLYANAEGIKDLRSTAISAKDGIVKQLKDLDKPREKFNFGNSNFNLINSNLYRQLEKLITLQLGSNGSEDIAEIAANSRAIYSKALLYDNGTNLNNLLKHIIKLNKVISLDYEKVLATIMNNDKEYKFLGLGPEEDLSTIFNRAFGDSRAGKANDKITSDLVYEFLKFVRIMSALPSDMVNTFKEEWIKLNKNPELFINKGYDSALPLALKSVPDASKYIDTDLSPIKEIQNIREEVRRELNVSRKDLNDYYKQSAPILDTEDLVGKIDAFKDFNNLSNLDFFNNSNLESIDKELQTKLSAFKILMKDLLDGRKSLEDELNRGTKIEYDNNGKKIEERDLTETEIGDINNQIAGIDLANKTYKSYLDKLEQSQIATQKLIQVSQVFKIKQKEIKDGFDNFRTISSSIGEVSNAFSDLDGRVGGFARTLNAFSNFTNIIADLVEKLRLLSEAEKAAEIAATVTESAINSETAATITNTEATTAGISVSTAKTATNVGEAASEGTKQASKLPFPANIAAIAAVLAAIGGAAATISSLSRKKYATGGIVNGLGSSFSDSIPISVSNGEMVLNKSQQKNLFDLLNYGGGPYRGGGSSEVNFKILGENLVGSINNRNKGRNKIL